MSRKVIIFLIVFMAMVMIGLILVQTNTINKTYKIREEQFDQTVNRTLKRVIDKMERDETFDIVNEPFSSSSSSEDILKLSKKDKNILYSNQINFSLTTPGKVLLWNIIKKLNQNLILLRVTNEANLVNFLQHLICSMTMTIIYSNNTKKGWTKELICTGSFKNNLIFHNFL